MLSLYDWIRLSRTGSELLATLKCISEEPVFSCEIGSPYSALNSPCRRCGIYSCIISDQEYCAYCSFCKSVIDKAMGLGNISRNAIVIWAFINKLPIQFLSEQNSSIGGFRNSRLHGAYIHDKNHFLLMMHRKELKPWLQELVLYNGSNLKGMIQIFPTIGARKDNGMGDILCRAIHHEANYPMDRLRVRFFSNPIQLLMPHILDQQGILTFEVSEFLNLLELVTVFRVILKPEEQKMLHEILTINDTVEEQFYWGRFQGILNQEAKDMLNLWKLRNWSKNKIKLLYKLIDYVKLR
jgi:hypothetical protein